MKSIFTFMMAIHVLSLFAAQWTDPETGIRWNYSSYGSSSIELVGPVDNTISGEVKIPSEIKGKSVYIIGEDAFAKCSRITRLIVPPNVVIYENALHADEIVFLGSRGFSINPSFSASFLGATKKVVVLTSDLHPDGYIPNFPDGDGYQLEVPFQYVGGWSIAYYNSQIGEYAGLNGYGIDVSLVTRPKCVAYGAASVSVSIQMITPKTMEVTYKIISDLPTLKVRAMAFKDGIRSFANAVPVRTGVGIPNGENVATNQEHKFLWDIANDWNTDLSKVAIEILVQGETLLPQVCLSLPETHQHHSMTITTNSLSEQCLFDALMWCIAEGDEQLRITDGGVFMNDTQIANGANLSENKTSATALLNYLYGKMGYKVLAGEDLEYAEAATRLDFVDDSTYPLRQVSVKIEEE